MLIGEALKKAASDLATAGVASPRLDAEILLALTLGLERTDLLARWDDVLKPQQLDKFETLMARRKKREPVARITGIQEFWSLPFLVSIETLIPRPDSEILVEAVLENVGRKKGLRILDLGTGTGCLILSLLSELPNTVGVASDISDDALACARDNAARLNLSGRVQFKIFDWRKEVPLGASGFDVILSNPPYIPTGDIAGLEMEVAKFAPKAALDGGPDGMDHFWRIIEKAPGYFSEKGGCIYLEVGDGQAGAVKTLLREAGFLSLEAYHDLAGRPRVVTGQFSKQ